MKRHIFTVSILLVAAQLFGQESRFWVGGSGKWNDMSHWSVTSGGEPGATLPESGTSVVFDGNSFSGDRNTVTLKDAVVIGSLTATDANFVFSGKNSLTVGGSVNVDDKASFGKLRGTLVLSAKGNQTLNLPTALEGGIIIDGGNWTLTSDLTTDGDITLKSGSFNTAGYNVTCAVFSATENATALNIENSTMLCNKWFTNSAKEMTVKAEGSEIVLKGSLLTDFLKAKGQRYNIVRNYSASKVEYAIVSIPTPSTCPVNADNYNEKPFNGTITVKVGNGIDPFNLIIMKQGVLTNTLVDIKMQTNNYTFGDLEPGDYSVGYFEGTIENGTSHTKGETVGPEEFGGSIGAVSDAHCWGDPIGLGATISGGTQLGGGKTYNYSWTQSGVGGERTTEEITAESGATYYLTISDKNECEFTVTQYRYIAGNPKSDYKGGPKQISASTVEQETCEGENTGVVTITPSGGLEGREFKKYELLGADNRFSNNPVITGLKSGDYKLIVYDSEGCSNLSNADENYVNFTIGEIPAPTINPGAEIYVCYTKGTFKVEDAVPTNMDGIEWTIVSGADKAHFVSGDKTANPILGFDAVGDVILHVEVTNGTCTPATDTKTIHIIGTPEPTIGANSATVCGRTATIVANASMGGTLVAEKVSGEGTVTPEGLTVTVSKAGTYTFKVKETETSGAGCSGYNKPEDNVTITFYDQPTASFSPNAGSMCYGDAPTAKTVTITNGDGATITWSHNGKGGFAGAGNTDTETYVPADDDAGEDVVLTVTVSNGVCTAATAQYTLSVGEKLEPTFTIASDICGLSTSVTATNLKTGSTVKWHSADGAVLSPDNAVTTMVSGEDNKTYTLYVTETKSGCPTNSETKTFTFHAQPTADAGAEASVCLEKGTFKVEDADASHDNILWTIILGGDKADIASGDDTKSPVLNLTKAGVVTLQMSVSNGTCTPATDTKTINIIDTPVPTIGANSAIVCGRTATIVANASMGGTLVAEKVSGEGTVTPDGLTVTVSKAGTYTFKVKETVSGAGCSGYNKPEDNVTITFYDQPTASFSPNAGSMCYGDDPVAKTVTITNGDGATITWAHDGKGGFAGAGNTETETYVPVDGDAGADVVLTVTVSNGVCTAATAQYTLTIGEKLAPQVTVIADVCGTETTATATNLTDGSTLKWHSDDGAQFSPSDNVNPVTVSGEAGKTYNIYVTESKGGCDIDSDSESVKFNTAPTVDPGTYAPVCHDGNIELKAIVENAASVKWSTTTGGKWVDNNPNIANAIYIPSDLDRDNGTVTLTVTATSECSACTPVSKSVDIEILPEMSVAVGGVIPFEISSTTEIKVHIEGSFKGGAADGLGMYLVAPNGETVKLYDHHDTYMRMDDWVMTPGDINVNFSTDDSAEDFDMRNFSDEETMEGNYKPAESWSKLYGMNPAEGGWAVRIGGVNANGGSFKHAIISFTDINYKGDLQTITFNSKEKNPTIKIKDNRFLSYVSPIGLRVSCFGMKDATAVANAKGGAGTNRADYTYEWSQFSDFSVVFSYKDTVDLEAGTFYVRVTDPTGCSAVTEVEVATPDKIHLDESTFNDVTCNGGNDGQIVMKAKKEDVTKFDFEFDLADFDKSKLSKEPKTLKDLAAGEYKVYVIDEDYCTDSTTFTIEEPKKLVITKIDTTFATSCKTNNGGVTFTVTGGLVEGDYHFEYMGQAQDQPDIVLNQATLEATNLAGASGIKFRIWDAATFDANDLEAGCFIDTTISTVAEGMELVISQSPNTCNGADEASISVTVKNGSGDYTYEWYDGNGLIATTTEGTYAGLVAGTYTVKVTDKNTMCDITSNDIELEDPDPIVITKNITSMPKCLGDETASFSITAEGGSAALTYAWKKDGADYGNATSFENVGAGVYSVIVSDGYCEAKDTIKVIEPTSKIAITQVDTTRSECVSPTGTAVVSIDGGYGTITYDWTLLRENSVKYSGPSESVSALGAGNYKLRVVDELGCADSLEVKIEDKGGLMADSKITEDVLCADRPTGKALITGVYDADYNTYDAQIVWADGTTHPMADEITGLKYGDNYVTVIAENGCISDEKITLKGENALRFVEENTFSEPDVLGDPNNNGQIIAVIAGGKKEYSYAWFDSNSSPITTNIEAGAERTALKGLKEGTYSVTVTDENYDINGDGCQISMEFTVEYAPVKISLAETSPVTCYDGKNGELTATVTGGYKNDTYYYEWRNLTSGAIVKSTGTQSVSNDTLTAGNYEVKVMQRNNLAKDSAIVEIHQPLTKLNVPNVAINTKGSYCYEASGVIKINEPATETAQEKNFGGTLPFKYKFSYSDWAVDSVENSRQNPEITKLASGDYKLVVEDARGCLSDTIVVNVADSSNFTITRIEPKKICFGSDDGVITIDAKVNDGSDYQYAWSNNATTKNIDNLKAGTYSVTVTATVKEQYTCDETATFEVEQYAPIMFSVSNSIVNSCYNTNDGVVSMANLRGGNNTYRRFEFFDMAGKQLYDSIPAAFVDTTATLAFKGLLSTGDYKVVVTDGDLNCHSDSVKVSVYSATPKIELAEIKDDEPLCYEYDKNGKLSYGKITVDARAIVTSQVSSTTADLALYFKLDGSDSQKAHVFDNVTAGQHNIVVGYGSELDCPVEIEHELNSKNNLKADAAFRNNQKVLFTCPDNLLSAYVTANNSYNTYKFYAMYNEDAENYGKAKASEPETQPDTAANAAAYRFNRGIYYRADSLGGDSANVAPVVEVPVYNHGKDIRGNDVTLFAQGNGSSGKVWADDFTPYGGETFYYFEIADAQCASIDSIKATSLQADEKLHATVLNDDDSEARFKGGEYEVAEGVKITLSAEQLQFNFDNAFVYSENSWSWDDAPADKLGGDGVGLVYATTKNGNPVSVMAYGRVMAKVRDSVAFELSDLTYNIDTTMVCYYYDSIIINSISGIKPADVVIANGMSDDNRYGKWNIEGLASYDKVTIYVFNRWGGRVWQYSGTGLDYDANRWDARNEKNKPVPSGTYYYVIQCSDGMLGGKKVTGPVTIIR